MTSENPLVARAGGELVEIVQTSPETPPEKPVNPFVLFHSLLRGRYPLAIVLALIGAVIGGPLGYFLIKLEYKSVGMVRIHPILPRILYQTEQNGIMPMFESFLASQVAQLQSRRVTGEAMIQPEWKALGRGLAPEEVAKFEASLEVVNPRGTPLIQVSFTDTDPKAAATAVKAVIETFKRMYNDNEAESGTPAIGLLDSRRIEMTAKLNGINDRILAIANDFGSASLKEVYEFKLGELNQVESQLRSASVRALLAGASNPTTGPTSQPAPGLDEKLAQRDPLLQDLYKQKQDADRQARVLIARYGANHPQVHDAQTSLTVIQQDIDARLQQLRSDALTPGTAELSPILPTGGPPTREQLRENEAALRRLYENLKAETIALGRKNLEIEKLRSDADETRELLNETKTRIDQLNVEKNVSGRISVLSYGDQPLQPEKNRRMAMVGLGSIGLAGLGVGIVLLMGLLDRRMQHIDTARSRLKRVERLLGVLPELPNDLTDPEQASSAAHCVHHIRAMLQIRQRTTGHKTYAITSPSPGDGKTSLVTTLGMSLAASGCRTLLIDCDMDGGGLTARLGRVARRQLGQILLDRGALGEAKLEEGLELARKQSIPLGQALVHLGYVAESVIERALQEQSTSSPGLGDVLGGASPEQAILSTGYMQLSILPLGSPPGAHAGKLAPEPLRRLLDRLAGQFDIVLIDCGPILGSVEAAIVSAEVDGVILVVSRGGDRNAAECAVNLLVSAGAQVEGIVFNRAEPADVAASIYSSSASIRSMRSGADRHQTHSPAKAPARDSAANSVSANAGDANGGH